ncbi:head maturation protease, ClpP-related [Bacillus massiliglaciei]|uniref:head maturation protease, ClpP-related n=1 Tax=Bacillus massiliglaciei TaxID=1816693 RepID=UPI000DA5F5A8|nr:head maturation protease, ClpP-related [Bacillus massiliglaciei]
MKRKFGFKNQKYNEQLASIPHNFAVVHDEEKGVSELTIYGDIGESWWGDFTSAKDVDNALKEAGSNDLVINLNSPGGSAFDGIAIYNRVKSHKGKVTIHVDGWACSAASIIAMAADELIMGAGSMLMIHEASTIVWGSKTLMRKEADMLEKLEDGIIDIYMTRANVEREEIRNMVNEETWFSANEALEIGFATATTSTVEGEPDEELAQMKVQMQTLQNELDKLKNTKPKNPAPVKQNRAVRIL